MLLPLCFVVDGKTTRLVADCIGWCYCHGGRWNDHPGWMCLLAGVKAINGWWNYHRSALILGLVLRCLAEPHPKYVADGICQCFYLGMDCWPLYIWPFWWSSWIMAITSAINYGNKICHS